MHSIALEFAPGTTEDCKKAVGGLFQAEDLLAAYRLSRIHCKTNDLVIVATESGLHFGTRADYAAHLRQVFGVRAREFGIVNESAHSVVKLPAEGDAMWFVVVIDGQDLPLMCVLYGVPYKLTPTN